MASKYPVRLFDYATVYNIVDGDTVDIEVDCGFSVKVRHRFRLARINTPERGAPGFAEATEFLRAAALNRPAIISSTKLDKFGRYLCELEVAGVNLNDAMLAAGLAARYE